MGSDYQPKVIFGLKLHKSKIIEIKATTVNLCSCEPRTIPGLHPGAKYCSKCGRLLNRPWTEEIPKFDGFDDPINNDSLSIKGWPVVVDTDVENFFVGFYVKEGPYGHTGDEKFDDFPDMSKMEQFKADMKEIDLWDEKMFGVWLVLYLSY